MYIQKPVYIEGPVLTSTAQKTKTSPTMHQRHHRKKKKKARKETTS